MNRLLFPDAGEGGPVGPTIRCISLWQPLPAPYLSGVISGDAWLTDLSLGMRVADHDFAEAFATSLNRVASLAKRPRKDERGFWLVRVSNKTGKFNWLRDVRIDDDVKIRSWLRGLFDSEGNACLCPAKISENSWNRRVSFYSTDANTVNLAAYRLEFIGIKLRPLRTVKPSKGHKGDKPVFEVKLAGGRENFTRFAELVGSSIKRKREVLQAIPGSYAPPGHHARAQAKGAAVRRARRDAGGTY